MKAAVLNTSKNLTIEKLNLPEPAHGEVRIRLTQVGICGSDVHIFLGHRQLEKPNIIGHEGIGFIDKIGEGVMGRSVGERIVIEPNIPCKRCTFCYSGRGNICINKRVIGVNEPGCFAEYICIPADFCWSLPDTISNEDAVTIEPMAVAYHALFASKAKPGDAIAVIGLGAVGLLVSHLALAMGYKVYVNELDPDKTKIATDQGAIAVECIGTLEEQISILSKTWLENNVSVVFECAGSAITASLATAAAPRGSEIILVGLSEKEATFRPLKIAREGITIVPSIIYDHPFDFQRVINLIEAKKIAPGHIISQYVSLDEIEKGLIIAAKGNESKIVVTII
jgi:L-iditol 2-dehydrogenase